MAAGARVTLNPIPLAGSPNGATWLTSGTPGYDTGTGTVTAWSGQLGVMIPNQGGNVILAYACGATLAGATQILVGDVIAGSQVLPATTYQYTIAANSSGWLGPWSPQTFNQQAPTVVTYSGAINTQALVAAAQGCVVVDFTTTTTLAVRAYSIAPVFP